MTKPFTHYGGFQIHTSIHMVEPGPQCQIHRSWRERLFTLPWRPLRATRWFTPMIPSSKIVGNGDRLYMHPEMAEVLRQNLTDSEGVLHDPEFHVGNVEIFECSMVPPEMAEPECVAQGAASEFLSDHPWPEHVTPVTSGLPFLINTTDVV